MYVYPQAGSCADQLPPLSRYESLRCCGVGDAFVRQHISACETHCLPPPFRVYTWRIFHASRNAAGQTVRRFGFMGTPRWTCNGERLYITVMECAITVGIRRHHLLTYFCFILVCTFIDGSQVHTQNHLDRITPFGTWMFVFKGN